MSVFVTVDGGRAPIGCGSAALQKVLENCE